MESVIQPTPLKMFKWYANDEGNNDDYCGYYNSSAIYWIDRGESSSINEEQLLERFVEKSMNVLNYLKGKRKDDKLSWKLIKHSEGSYSVEYWDEINGEHDRSTLTSLEFTTENVFQSI